jgi:hypothetical protein
MRSKFLSAALAVAIAVSLGCSVYKAGTQPGPADLTGIGVCTPRQELIMRLGAPKFSDTNPAGRKEDAFEFSSGLHQASKARIILYLAADLVTLCLAEIILWPMELTVMERATCNGFAAYDEAHKVETWKVSQKDGVQGC